MDLGKKGILSNIKDCYRGRYSSKCLYSIALGLFALSLLLAFSSCKQLFESDRNESGSSITLQLPPAKRSMDELCEYYEVRFSRSGLSDVVVRGNPGAVINSGELPEGLYDVEVYAYSFEGKQIGVGKKTNVRVSDGEITYVTITLTEIIEQEPMIGEKERPDVVGDIVFSDGSATAYSAGLTLTDKQKASAIAVIFYAGTSSDKLGERILGVGLKQNVFMWTFGENPDTYAESYFNRISDLVCDFLPESYVELSTPITDFNDITFNGKTDGRTNLSILRTAVSDYSESNYPAWYWIDHYGDTVKPPVTATSDWYMPTIAELCMLCFGKDTVNSAVLKCTGQSFVKEGSNKYYWSSSQSSADVSYADPSYAGDFNLFDNITQYADKNEEFWVCAIIQF